MAVPERLHRERFFHDQQALIRAHTYREYPEWLVFPDEVYLNHETWIRPAMARLGDVRGLDVLDYGCGNGMAAVVLARHGARVTAFDLSPGYLAEARQRARANEVAVRLVQADGERLPFADAMFDRVWGNAVLHHLDLAIAGGELWRVLRPGGVAVFCEPWGENFLLNWARRRLPYRGKQRTVDEQPLRRRQLECLRQRFARLEIQGFQLLSMARRVLPQGRFMAGLEWVDERLLAWVPVLQRFCRYAVLTLHR